MTQIQLSDVGDTDNTVVYKVKEIVSHMIRKSADDIKIIKIEQEEFVQLFRLPIILLFLHYVG